MFSREVPLCVDSATPLQQRGAPLSEVRPRPILLALATWAMLGFGPSSEASETSRERVGPLHVDEERRRTVRGGRGEFDSIHVAWTPTASRQDAADRDALSAFERAHFPAHTPLHTLERAPQPWMERLERPALPIRWNKRTADYLRYFKDDPRGATMMRAWMRRAGRYEDRMRAIFRELGLPEDLVMVVLAESGFNPRARSSVGAAGPWQFMEGTGAVYGLRTSYWVDERFDVEKATYAAGLYLKDLHVRFGSWELALAAFNAGYGLILTTIERHNTNNYWTLCEVESGLPYATTNYVPKILAAAIIARNRKVFGVDDASIDPLPAADWVEVRVQQSTSLGLVAKALDVDADLLEEYNSALIRGRTPPRRGNYGIRIPRDKLEAFKQAAVRLRKAWSVETTYDVRHGDRLESIAARHGIDERTLRRINGIRDSAEIVGGITLVVPLPPSETIAGQTPVARPLAAVPSKTAPDGRRPVFFVTTRATTPRSLESAFHVPWADIVRWNGLDPSARLQSDQVLQIWVRADFDPQSAHVLAYAQHEVDWVIRGSRQHIEAALARRGLARRGYRVRRGDTLKKIGRRFDLTVGSLARINGFDRSHEPTPGDVVIVYVPEHRLGGTTHAPPPRGFETEPSPERRVSVARTIRLP